jgi:hypothetical protein
MRRPDRWPPTWTVALARAAATISKDARSRRRTVRKLIVANFVTLDGLYEGKDKGIDYRTVGFGIRSFTRPSRRCD